MLAENHFYTFVQTVFSHLIKFFVSYCSFGHWVKCFWIHLLSLKLLVAEMMRRKLLIQVIAALLLLSPARAGGSSSWWTESSAPSLSDSPASQELFWLTDCSCVRWKRRLALKQLKNPGLNTGDKKWLLTIESPDPVFSYLVIFIFFSSGYFNTK